MAVTFNKETSYTNTVSMRISSHGQGYRLASISCGARTVVPPPASQTIKTSPSFVSEDISSSSDHTILKTYLEFVQRHCSLIFLFLGIVHCSIDRCSFRLRQPGDGCVTLNAPEPSLGE
jgi:hypothetical protein